jgi:hypothetical protein
MQRDRRPYRIYIILFTIFLSSGQFIQGQTISNDTLQQTKHNGSFLNFAGASLAIGNSPSPIGWVGASIIVSTKNFEVCGGMGWNNVKKLHLGLAYHFDLKKQFCPIVSTECVFSLGRGFVFNEGKTEERHYQVKAAQLINFGTGIIWTPKKWLNKDIASIFLKVGYRQLISNYSITPQDPSKIDNSEINSMYHDLFASRLYWSIGLRWGGLL